MPGERQSVKWLRVVARDYFVAWTLGNVAGLLFWMGWARGDIKIVGYWRMIRAVWQGHLIIAANHPSLIETVIIEAMTWPWFLVFRRFFIWSMPDDALFPTKIRWLYDVGRCIVVDRQEVDKKRNRAAIRQALGVLNGRNTISIHPEGGRTRKAEQRGVKLLGCGSRRLGEINPVVISLAKTSEASILTLWVEMTPERESALFENFSIRTLLRKDLGSVVLKFENAPYKIEPSSDREIEKAKLERLLLCPCSS